MILMTMLNLATAAKVSTFPLVPPPPRVHASSPAYGWLSPASASLARPSPAGLLLLRPLLPLSHYFRLLTGHTGRGVTVFSFFANIATFVHYSVETFWFRELYLSVMIPICLVVVVQVVNSVLLERKSIKMRKLREANSSEKLD